MEVSYKSELSNMVAARLTWLLSTWNVACVTEKLNFEFYFIFTNLNVYSHTRPGASNLDSTDLDNG